MHGPSNGAKKENDNAANKQTNKNWKNILKYSKEENNDAGGQHGDHFFHDGKQFYLLRQSGLQILVVVQVGF